MSKNRDVSSEGDQMKPYTVTVEISIPPCDTEDEAIGFVEEILEEFEDIIWEIKDVIPAVYEVKG